MVKLSEVLEELKEVIIEINKTLEEDNFGFVYEGGIDDAIESGIFELEGAETNVKQ